VVASVFPEWSISPYISPTSPVYPPYISSGAPVVASVFPEWSLSPYISPTSPVYLPYISAGAPVVASVFPEWIAHLLHGAALPYPYP